MDGDNPKSSSPDRDGPADAVLWSGDQPTGPVRLPEQNAERFLAEFNRTYGALGLKMSPADDPRP